MTVINPFDFFLEKSAKRAPLTYSPDLANALAPYLTVRERGRLLNAWLAEVELSPRPTVQFLVDLNARLNRDAQYTVRMEPGVQSLARFRASARPAARSELSV